MPADQAPDRHLGRRRMVTQALWLVSISVVSAALAVAVAAAVGAWHTAPRHGSSG